MRARSSKIFIALLILPWIFSGWGGIKQAQAQSWLSGYSYRKQITITGQSGAGTNYQVKLLVGESAGATGEQFDLNSHCSSFPNDIRFTGCTALGADCETNLLDHWLESTTGTTPDRLATFWVEVQEDLGSNRNIYIYYGKSDATTGSNIANTFIFGDDFDDGNISDWTLDPAPNSPAIVSSQYISSPYSVYSGNQGGMYHTVPAQTGKFIAEFHTRYTNSGDRYYYMFLNEGGTNSILIAYFQDYLKYYVTSYFNVYDTAINTWYKIKQVVNVGTDTYDIYVNDALKKSAAGFRNAATQIDRISFSSNINFPNPGYVDDVRVRKYAATEPAFSSAGSEEGPTFEQSAYRLFNNLDSTNVGTALATQDNPATLGSSGAAFRLRALLHIGTAQLGLNGQSFKLQFAQRGADNLCDTAFSGETYADITAATVIAYNDNSTPADGAALTANAGDPTHGADTIVNQTYEELNNFTNSVAAIPAGQDGKWDFALKDNSAPAGTCCCFRAVKSNGSLLDTYTVIPEITTFTAVLSISVSPLTWGVGTVDAGTVQVSTSGNKINVTNDGNVAETFTLQIYDEDDRNEWTHSSLKTGAGNNIYVLSGIFCATGDSPIQASFNETDSEDVLTTTQQTATSAKFAYAGGSANAVSVPVNGVRSLWLRLDMPTAVSGTYAYDQHTVIVRIGCQQS